jgi:GH24 family phage-related lysozyme (muramidase)
LNRRLRLAIYSVFSLILCPVIPDYGSRRDHLFDANDNYSSALDTLRHYEGLETSPYYLIDGTYIGYGHKNREGLKSISKEQADSILDADMGYCLTRAQKRTGLYGDKSLAVALMFFTMGEDRFCKTDIYKRFSSGDVSNLNITDYCIINGKENARKKRFLTFVEHLFTNE